MMKAIHRRHIFLYALGIVMISIACLAGAAEAPAIPIPFKRESPAEETNIVRVVIGFGITILALGVSLYVLRKRLGANSGETPGVKQLQVVETRRLSSRSTLYVVEFAGACYLIAESGQSVTCLAPETSTRPGQ